MSNQVHSLKFVETTHLPENPEPGVIYRLLPLTVEDSYYDERTDRNIGIISATEQEILRKSVVGVAGTGGMGGLAAAQLARIGVAHLKIADSEVFDNSNLNRQFAARRGTIGKNKAFETARAIRQITPDVLIDVYPSGINAVTAEHFVDGCSVICDEIEFFAVKPRLQLHQAARQKGISLFCCDVIGFGTRIFFFTPESMTMEAFLGLSGEEKMEPWVIRRLLSRFAPELPPDISEELVNVQTVGRQKATIFGGTPPLSAGILLDCLCLYLMGTQKRPWVVNVPEMPGYCLFDVGQWRANVYTGVWWNE